MNKFIVLSVVIVVGVFGWMFLRNNKEDVLMQNANTTQNAQVTPTQATSEKRTVTPGSYKVDTSKSVVNWAGKKPLIDGYINSGTLNLTSGVINVDQTQATGSFEIAMDTLKVGLTAKKPNQETKLEEHLKGERWFNVAAYPTAAFTITKVVPHADSATTFNYTVVGDLTLKGITKEVTFEADIYETAPGTVTAEASTEIDRTQWGITASSASFFDNLADNAVDNMIGLSFTLVATK